jgi:ABC-type glycerol-3-phosphate transport system permease component
MHGVRVKREKSVPTLILQIVLLTILVLYALSLVVILGLVLLNSVKLGDVYSYAYMKLPFGKDEYGESIFRLKNYAEIFQTMRFDHPTHFSAKTGAFRLILNSVLYAVGCTLLQTGACCLMSYVVARYKNFVSKIIYTLVLVIMVIPIVGAMASEVKMLNMLGAYDTIFGAWLLSFNFLGMHFLILHAGFDAIPKDYSEAAQIDGAGHLKIFLNLMLPLVSSTITAVFVLQFIANFNDFQTPMMYVPNSPTIAYGLYQYKFNSQTEPTRIIAATMFSCLPIIAIFIVFRNKIMEGVARGGLKG